MNKVMMIAGLLLLACGCGSQTKKADAGKSAADTLIEVKVEMAQRQSVEQIREYTGTISPNSKNMISSQSAMRIDQILAEVGDHVRAGQVLVRMEETQYLQQKLQAENLKTDYERAKTLYQTGGVSKQQIDQLKTQLDVAQEALVNLEKNTRLLSPISGVVTQRNFDNGDVTGGQPILQVQQLQPVKIMVNVQEEYFALMKQGMQADIKVDIYEGKAFLGRVSLIYPTIDNTTHTFVVEILLPNQDMKVRPGMFARVVLNFGRKERIVAPDKAIVKQPGTDERFVYVILADGVAERRTVTLGQRLSNAYEILSGIDNGEKLAIAGISRLTNGTIVKEVE